MVNWGGRGQGDDGVSASVAAANKAGSEGHMEALGGGGYMYYLGYGDGFMGLFIS